MTAETDLPDLRPAADLVTAVVRGVADDHLGGPTPCPDYTVGDLLDHLNGLALAFTRAARKETSVGDSPPQVDAAHLPETWREVIPERLAELAQAWQDPGAWAGQTAAGGLEMDGATAGLVALDELVLHGWDLAVATGQDYAPDEARVAGARSFVAQFSGPGTDGMRQGLFGPEQSPPDGATDFEVLLAMAGRDPRAGRSGTGPA